MTVVFPPEISTVQVDAAIGEYVPPFSDVEVTYTMDSGDAGLSKHGALVNTGTRFFLGEPITTTGTVQPGELLVLSADIPLAGVSVLWRVVIRHRPPGATSWLVGLDRLMAVQPGETGPLNLASRLGSTLAPTNQANVPTWPGLMQVFARSVNGVSPDSQGNVTVAVPDGATIETVTINPLPAGSAPTGSVNGTELRLALPESQDRAITADITTGAVGSSPDVVVTSDSTSVDLSFTIPPPGATGGGGSVDVITGEVLVTALGSTPTVTVTEPTAGTVHLAIQVPVSGALLGAGGLTAVERITTAAYDDPGFTPDPNVLYVKIP